MLSNTNQSEHLSVAATYFVSASLLLIFGFVTILVLLYIQNPFTENVATPVVQPTPVVESDIQSWTSYENPAHNISIDIPSGWFSQDYSSFYNNGGTFVAFSPTELPCATCSYLNNGYFSLNIYNQQTDPNLYALYQNKTKKADNDATYKKISMDGKVGILYGNSVSVESDGWIVDINLDKNNGNDAIENSTIMKHVLSSFKVTKLFK